MVRSAALFIPRAAGGPDESVGVGIDRDPGMHIEGGALGVADAVVGPAGALTLQCPFDGLLDTQGSGVPQIQVRKLGRQPIGVGQAITPVRLREPGDVECAQHTGSNRV